MKNHHYYLLGLISLLCGMILFAWFNEFILIRTPFNTQTYTPPVRASKKTVTLYFWHTDAWHIETQDIIWHTDATSNLYYLIKAWLNVLDEEQVLDKKIGLQTALIAASGHEAYISFDRNPFDKTASTFEKWMLIEGLLKTIRENNIPIQQVQLLVHHQPLHDMHLDFSKAWRIEGFIAII